jgi:hypothetical protein
LQESGIPCRVSSRHDPGLDHVALSPSNCGFCVHQWCAHLASELVPPPSPQLFKLPRTRRWRTMGRTFRTMSTRTLMPGHSKIGNRIPRFPVFWGDFNRFPIPDWPGIGNRETGRFPIDSAGNRESGSRGGTPGISWSARRRRRRRTGGRGVPLTPGLGVVSKYSPRSTNSETIDSERVLSQNHDSIAARPRVLRAEDTCLRTLNFKVEETSGGRGTPDSKPGFLEPFESLADPETLRHSRSFWIRGLLQPSVGIAWGLGSPL